MENRKLNPYLVALAVFAVLGLIFISTAGRSGSETSCENIIKSQRTITWEELAEIPGPVRGCGLTVFKGTEVESFEVQLDGAVPHPIFRNEKMILVRMGYPLIGSQVLAGMSGSPVYFRKDGEWRLAGAIAFGFKIPTAGKSLGGITPIQAMLSQRNINFNRKPDSSAEKLKEQYLKLKSRNSEDPVSQEKNLKEIESLQMQIISEMSKPVTVGTYNGIEIQSLQPVFSLSAKSGSSSVSSDKVTRPKPGDAVTMMLVDGDIQLGGTCTVTYVTETKFWACGHPILMDGAVVAPARMASIATSYKGPIDAFKMVGGQHESAGYISYDGMFAIEGNLEKAPENAMIPVKINLDLNGQTLSINYRVFRHPIYTEAMIAQVGAQALEPLWNPNRKAVITSKSTISYDKKSLDLYESSTAGPPMAFGPFLLMANPWAAIGRTAQMTGKLVSSEWKFDVKSVGMDIRLKEGEGVVRSDILKVLNSKNEIIDSVSPGEDIKLLIPLRTDQVKKNFIKVVPLKVPLISEIKNMNPEDDTPSVTISVESGNYYNERDEKKLSSGIPENKEDFINQILVNERDPQKIFVQMVLPPTKIRSESPKKLSENYESSWRKVTSLKFLQSIRSVERKIIRAELTPPDPQKNYILNIDSSVRLRLNLPKPAGKKEPAKP